MAIVGGVFWFRRYRKQKKNEVQKEDPSEMDTAGSEGMGLGGRGELGRRGELGGMYKQQSYTDEQAPAFTELDTRVKKVPELGGEDRRVVAELDSTPRY